MASQIDEDHSAAQRAGGAKRVRKRRPSIQVIHRDEHGVILSDNRAHTEDVESESDSEDEGQDSQRPQDGISNVETSASQSGAVASKESEAATDDEELFAELLKEGNKLVENAVSETVSAHNSRAKRKPSISLESPKRKTLPLTMVSPSPT
jgi:hypothetical protein